MMNNEITSTAKRGTASFILALSFILLPFTGMAIHIGHERNPGFLLHAMMAVHTVAGFIFTAAVVFHVKYNWKSLARHVVKNRTTAAVVAASMIALLLIALFH